MRADGGLRMTTLPPSHKGRPAKLGEMLKSMEKAKGTRGQLRGRKASGATKSEAPEKSTETLSDLGITYAESSRAQKAAHDGGKGKSRSGGQNDRHSKTAESIAAEYGVSERRYRPLQFDRSYGTRQSTRPQPTANSELVRKGVAITHRIGGAE